MQQVSDLAFAGSDLDRAQALRGDAAALAGLRATGRVLPLWRGRPLFAAEGLAWLEPGHQILAAASATVFLGCRDGRGLFAADVSSRPFDDAPGVPFLSPDMAEPDGPPGAAYGDLRQRLTLLPPVQAELAATAKALLDWHRSHRFCAACGAESHLQAGGWHRLCPACGRQHFPRTDPVVIMLVTHGNHTLIGRSPGWPDGMYSCLAGFMEPGETLEAAVRREVDEETGIPCGAVTYVASQPWPFPASLMLGAHARAMDTAITLDPVELEAACWVSREEMLTVFCGAHPQIRAPRRGAIAHNLLALWLADRLG